MARKKKETIEEVVLEVTEETLNKKYRVISPGGLRVRQEPSLFSEIIKVCEFGTIVEGIGKEKENFIPISNGYMLKEFLEEVV